MQVGHELQKKHGIWASFVESMQLRFEYKPIADLFQATGTSVVPTECTGKVHFYTTVLDDRVYQSQIKSIYSGPSVQQLCRKYHLICQQEKDVGGLGYTGTGTNIAPGSTLTFEATASASALLRAVHVFVYKISNTAGNAVTNLNSTVAHNLRSDAVKFAAGGSRETDLEQITRVTMSGGGRTIFSCSPENSLLMAINDGFAVDAGSTSKHFVYRFATDPADGKWSSGASLSGISSQHFKVEAFIKRRAAGASSGGNDGQGNNPAPITTGDFDARYRMLVIGESYQVVSTSSSDGSVKIALSG